MIGGSFNTNCHSGLDPEPIPNRISICSGLHPATTQDGFRVKPGMTEY